MFGFVVVFFFFQAEDGIRDVAVTGVQTCALPICFRAFCLLESAFQVGWAEPVVPNGRRRVTGVARAGTIVFCEKLFADAKFVAHLLKRWIGERHRKWPHRDCAAGRISPSNACWPVSTKS